jgi:hypothetical protein
MFKDRKEAVSSPETNSKLSQENAKKIGQQVIDQTLHAHSDSAVESFSTDEFGGRFEAKHKGRQFESVEQIRTVKILENGNLFEQPSEEVIAALQKDDARIDVIHADNGSAVWDVLADRLSEDFADHKIIAIRSIEASLDGLVSDGENDTHDIRDILRVGDFTIRPGVNFAGFEPGKNKDGVFRIPHRVVQFGSETDFYRTGVVGDNVEGIDRIFPAVLVYDIDLLGESNGNTYGKRMPDSAEERAKIIQKAYILDTEIKAHLQ